MSLLRHMQATTRSASTPEGPYEVDGEPPSTWSADLDMLRLVEFVSRLQSSIHESLPVGASGREIGLILVLVSNHFGGRLTTISSLARGSGLSYGTALRAIDAMMQSGLIVRRVRTATGKSHSLHPSEALLRRWQMFAKDVRQLGGTTFGGRASAAALSHRLAPGERQSVIPPPAALAEKLVLSKGLRILVHADPTFMVMHALKRQFEMILGLPIRSKALSIDRLREEIVANSELRTSQYDIVAVDLPWFGDMAARGRLLPLDDLIRQSKLNISDFLPEAVASARSAGHQYGIPVLTTAEMLVYRSDLLEAAGIAPPRTISATLDAARRLHAPEQGISGIAWNGGRGTALGHTFMVVMAAHGQPIVNLSRHGDAFDVDGATGENLRPVFLDEAALATAEYLRELLPMSPPGVLNMTWYERAKTFAGGGAALAYSHTLLANLSELDPTSPAYGRTGYMPHPTARTGRPIVPLGGYALSIPANVAPERVPAIWTALCAITSQGAAKLYATNGSLASPRFSVNRDPEVASLSPMIGAVDRMARQGILRMWPRPPVPGISTVISIAGEEIHDMLTGQKTPLQALSDAQSRADAALRGRGLY